MITNNVFSFSCACYSYVSRFISRSERFQANSGAIYTNLYVKNLDSEVTEDILREKFSQFGEITSLLISKDENGVSKGFGFVNFEHSNDAKRAEESMHGTQLGKNSSKPNIYIFAQLVLMILVL